MKSACAAVEAGPIGQGDALQHAVDRMRALVRDSLRYHQHWQARADEAELLRAELESVKGKLAVVKGELEAARAELAAIQGSRGFRLLQRLYGLRLFLMPRGSRRERLGAVAFRMARGTVRGPAEEAPPASVAVSTPPVAPSPTVAEAAGNSLPVDTPPRERTDIDDQTYRPRCWQLIEKSPPAAPALNLIILSANHRAGSTLLQRICNARKGTLIWGEHGGSLSYFREIYATAGYSAVSGTQNATTIFVKKRIRTSGSPASPPSWNMSDRRSSVPFGNIWRRSTHNTAKGTTSLDSRRSATIMAKCSCSAAAIPRRTSCFWSAIR